MAITVPNAAGLPIMRTRIPSFLGRTTDVLTKANNSYAGTITYAQTAHTTTAKGILNTGTVTVTNAGDFQILIPVPEIPAFFMGCPVAIYGGQLTVSKPTDSVGDQTIGNAGGTIRAMDILASESTANSVAQAFNATQILRAPSGTQYCVGAASATPQTVVVDNSATLEDPAYIGSGVVWVSLNIVVPTGSGTCRYDIQLDAGSYIDWYPVK